MMHVKQAALDSTALKPLERKDEAGLPAEIKAALDTFKKTFEEFKSAHAEEVGGMKKKFDDVVSREKVDRINEGLDQVKGELKNIQDEIIKAKRIGTGGDGDKTTPEMKAYSDKFGEWFRKGNSYVGDAELRDLQRKALANSTDVDGSGGFSVRPEMDSAIEQTVKDVSPIRSIATVVSIGTQVYQKLVNRHGVNSGWVMERQARPQTLAPDLVQVDFPAFEVYAMPAATQMLLEDSTINIDQWIADEVSLEFAQKEGAAFVAGTGAGQPAGIISGYNVVADSSFVWGSLGYIPTGAAGAFAAGIAGPNALIDTMFALRAPYRANGSWLVGRLAMRQTRKLVDGQGNYIVDLRLRDNYLVESIFGRPVVEAEDMPAPGANSLSMAYGDFKAGYVIVDRRGSRVIRDEVTSKPYVLFYTTKRVGGGVKNFEAIKLLRFSVT